MKLIKLNQITRDKSIREVAVNQITLLYFCSGRENNGSVYRFSR